MRRSALTLVALATAGLVVVHRRVLGIERRPSWPPPPDAVTPDGAQAATEAFAARASARPRDAALDFAWSTAATLEPWADGENFFPRIFADVEAARSSVHILMFGWREGEVGMRMASLLERKLAEGVEVQGHRRRARLEALHAGARDVHAARRGGRGDRRQRRPPARADRPLPRRPRRSGASTSSAAPTIASCTSIDGTVAWTGGAGIEDHFNDGRFHDLMVRVTGDVVRQAQAAFLTSFRGHGGPLPADLSRLFPAPAEPGSTPIALAQVIPGGFVAASQAIREQIDQARERLDVMNPYLTDHDTIEQLLAAARRGVKVRVVVSENSNNHAATAALKHRYADLDAAAIEVWEVPNTVVHAKVVDRRRRRQLRHAQPRRLGALPQLRAHDDRQEPAGRGTPPGAAVRARHRPLQARRRHPRARANASPAG